MKALITTSGQYGPFTSITQGDDRWVCDDVEYQFSVIGDATVGEWVAPPPPTPPVPPAVSPRQIRQAMSKVPYGVTTLRSTVEAAIAASDQDTKDWYEWATQFERGHPMVAALGGGLGVASEDLDNLWRLAGSL
jgi:hypothetical protein